MNTMEANLKELEKAFEKIDETFEHYLKFDNDCRGLKYKSDRDRLKLFPQIARQYFAAELKSYKTLYDASQAFRSPEGKAVIDALGQMIVTKEDFEDSTMTTADWEKLTSNMERIAREAGIKVDAAERLTNLCKNMCPDIEDIYDNRKFFQLLAEIASANTGFLARSVAGYSWETTAIALQGLEQDMQKIWREEVCKAYPGVFGPDESIPAPEYSDNMRNVLKDMLSQFPPEKPYYEKRDEPVRGNTVHTGAASERTMLSGIGLGKLAHGRLASKIVRKSTAVSEEYWEAKTKDGLIINLSCIKPAGEALPELVLAFSRELSEQAFGLHAKLVPAEGNRVSYEISVMPTNPIKSNHPMDEIIRDAFPGATDSEIRPRIARELEKLHPRQELRINNARSFALHSGEGNEIFSPEALGHCLQKMDELGLLTKRDELNEALSGFLRDMGDRALHRPAQRWSEVSAIGASFKRHFAAVPGVSARQVKEIGGPTTQRQG